MQDRDNQRWLGELRSEGATLNVALTDLRDVLSGHLRRVFKSRPGFVDSMLDDLLQESLIRILKSLKQFQDRSQFVTWATAIAIRVGMTELRRRRWQDVSLDTLIADTGFEPASDEPAGSEPPPIVAAMYRVIEANLTEKQRTVLLAEIKGMAQEAIAHQMGSNRNAVYKLSHDARRRLKQGLEQAGFAVEDFSITNRST